MAAWIPDICPGDDCCEIVTIGPAGEAMERFAKLCAFHASQRHLFANDHDYHDAIVASNRARESARGAAKLHLRLDKEHPGVWYRNESDGSVILGVNHLGMMMPKWPTSSAEHALLSTVIKKAAERFPRTHGVGRVRVYRDDGTLSTKVAVFAKRTVEDVADFLASEYGGIALQVGSNNQAGIGNNAGAQIFGGDVTSTEGNNVASWRQAGTFSKLGRSNLGGSGTNVTRFRVAGGNGNQVLSAAGTGYLQDNTNVDTIAANTTINILNTDNGTNPTYGVWKVLFRADGDHCAYSGMAGTAVVYDVPSATRFIGFAGIPVVDGAASEGPTQILVRGPTAMRSFQVRVTGNVRTNTSTFRTRIGAGNGNGIVQFATMVTGLVIDDTNSDTLASGDLINASITLDTGTEDLTASIVACALTNATAPKSDLVLYSNTARTASATPNYMALGGNTALTTETTEADVSLTPGFPGLISNLRANVLSPNTYTGSCTVSVMKNGVAALTLTIAAGATGWQENTTSTLAFTPTDTLSLEIVGGTANSITIIGIMTTIQEISGGLTSDWRPQLITGLAA